MTERAKEEPARSEETRKVWYHESRGESASRLIRTGPMRVMIDSIYAAQLSWALFPVFRMY